MEKNFSPERWRRLAAAVFDRYVTSRMIEGGFIVTEDGVDDQDLCNFAKQIGCTPGALRAAVVNACSRITKEHLCMPISPEDEADVMKATTKQHLKEVSVSLLNFKRGFGKVVQELNHKNIGLHTNVDELKAFVGPLHAEVIAEFYELSN